MRFVRSMEYLTPNTRKWPSFPLAASDSVALAERERAKLRSSHGHLTVTKTYLGPLGIVYTVLGFTAALIFFFRRSWWVAKALAVPPLAGTIVEYYKKSHDGISPVCACDIDPWRYRLISILLFPKGRRSRDCPNVTRCW